jgi:RimJ/RimL family protein N-acetyltransferase
MYQWRNNAATRRYFFDPAEIEYREHCDWFEKVLAAEDIVLLVVEERGYPMGVVRFNFQEEGQTAEVSVYVDPARHGAGLGKKVLTAGECYLRRNSPGVRAITAQVMQENIASRKLFIQAGFVETGSNVYRKWVGSKGGAVS